MATDIKISELNEITVNNDLNQIIVNNRENSGDSGITKKIQISNLLTPNIVKTSNITDCAVTTNKIDNNSITCDKIADNTITSDQVTCCGISNGSLATNSVDNRVINNSDNFTFNCVTAATNVNTPLATVTDKLTVGALGCGKTVSLNGINYDFPATETPNYFLQTDGSGNLDWAEAVPGDGTALVFSDIVPVGTIIPWAGAALPADGKWLECNGTTFDGTDFPELSAVLGDTWGTHSGVNYYLPNLQGRAAVGAGIGNDGTDSYAFTLGAEGGKYNHTLNTSQMPVHSHDLSRASIYSHHDAPPTATVNYLVGSRDTGAVGAQAMSLAGSTRGYICGTGGSQSHNNIQPYAVTRYVIKAKPDDIQQFGMNVGPGLSALDASGGQTASIDLSSSEIGLKVSDQFTFDGSGRLENLMIPPIWTIYPDLDAQLIGTPHSAGLTPTINPNFRDPVEIVSRGNSSGLTFGQGQPGEYQLTIGRFFGNQASIKIYVPVAVTRTIRARRQYNVVGTGAVPWTLRAWDEPSRLISGSRFNNTAVWSVDPFFDTTILGIQDVSMNLPAGTYIFTLRGDDDVGSFETIFYTWDQGGLIDYKTVYPVLNEPGDPLWDYTGGP